MAKQDDPWVLPADDNGLPKGFALPSPSSAHVPSPTSLTPPPPPLATASPAPAAPGQLAPPAGAPYPYGYAANPAAKNWMGITALISSLVLCILPVNAIAAVIFGHLSLGACKRGEANNRGLGLAGLIVGYSFGSLSVLYYIVVLSVSVADPYAS